MPARSRATLKKRQKEIARMEKQRDKAAKRMQRRLAKQHGESAEAPPAEPGGAPPAAAEEEKLPEA